MIPKPWQWIALMLIALPLLWMTAGPVLFVTVAHRHPKSLYCWRKVKPGFIPGYSRLDLPLGDPEEAKRHAACMGLDPNSTEYQDVISADWDAQGAMGIWYLPLYVLDKIRE